MGDVKTFPVYLYYVGSAILLSQSIIKLLVEVVGLCLKV